METFGESKLDAHSDLGSSNERFDASQYAFFGRDVTQEVELGGLDEDDDVGELDVAEEVGEDTFSGIGEAEEVNTMAGDPGNFRGHLNAELSPDAGDVPFNSVSLNWPERHVDENQYDLGGRTSGQRQKQHMLPRADVEGLFRPAPPYQQQQRWAPEPNQLNLLGTYPIDKPQTWHGQPDFSTVHASGPYITPSQYRPSFSGPQHQYSGVLPSLMQYGGPPNFVSQGLPIPPQLQSGKWMAQSNLAHGGLVSGSVSGMMRHPMHQRSPLMPPQVLLQYQRPQSFPSSVAPPYAQGHHQQVFGSKPLSPQGMRKPAETGVAGDFKEQRHDRGRPTPRYQQPSVESNNYTGRRSNDGLPQMKSKYMTVEEVENIVRIQWAATHSSDPYIDDYYHQAVQAKLSGATPHGRRHFAPSHLRDLPSHTRAAAEPHAFLQVDALGRIPFSSIRRPRPLLEMDTSSGMSGEMGTASSDKSLDIVASQRRLEQEPMLAARIAIEDGLCLLLDVDDIDRLLSLPQASDSGTQLQRRRQILLEGLAASLHLADPLASNVISNGEAGSGCFGLAGKDDLIFLRLVSLPKGRKLVARYLRLIVPGSELSRIVAMAVFRHLRFLFGGPQIDPSATVSSKNLANAVACSVLSMDLPSLSACIAAVVLAPESPPLRPIGNAGGDGATVILQAVLERATSLLKDKNSQYPRQNRAIWQASFDAFFVLLSKYCTNKYESILHSLMMASPGNAAAVNASAASAMAREMPIELLRASIPHTNEQQKKQLLDFAQRSIAVGGTSSYTDSRTNVGVVRS
ncbi:hypothetical protein O6H91_06G111800 [Diphasiastrum complanatum]|uniref:Uncharacterized protein n=2 Tax=Diphasiastrum complanatum TaxID=34168 RepID=A0ACC2DEA4_DIPCM|nr:hypothetical protein O6H91_06G062000 [Diphasiastrum complanatum]KAJ7553762.1 hypothetical protein O6H91_06G111800 [Diphasiastrum complanatum]